MPHCPKCGQEISETDNFCRHCSSNLADMNATSTPEEVVKAVLIQRIEGIRKKDAGAIMNLVDKERYTKFDDWPPFERQGSDALNREAEAIKVLKEYNYDISDWKIDVFNNAAIARTHGFSWRDPKRRHHISMHLYFINRSASYVKRLSIPFAWDFSFASLNNF